MFAKTLIASALFAAVASATTCPSTEITKLVPIASNSNLSTCQTDSGYNLLAPTVNPDTATLTKMCASTACKALIAAVIALNPSDCDLTIGSATINVYSLTSTFDADCAALTTAPASTTATPTTTTATPTTTTTTPATDAPATTTATPTTSNTTATDAPLAC